MNRMRTIDAAAAYLRETDPETALSKTELRRLVITGALPSVKVGTSGNKRLINLEVLDRYLAGELQPELQPVAPVSKIRAIK